jgi:hypothetical protein
MKQIGLAITFTDDGGATRDHSFSVAPDYDADAAGEHRLAHILLAELKIMVGKQGPPKHNATARAWLEFPNTPTNITEYFDVENAQAVWRELANLIMGAENDLILSQAFKALEPSQEPPFEDDTAINDLYYLHDRKITLLNQTVHQLVKVQDIVNRLLHESLGGDLVDAGKPDWERTQLTRRNVSNGLEAKRAAGWISQADFDAITQALTVPDNTPHAATSVSYRNRLMHHVRPSVDYSIFYPALQSRMGEEIKDAQGNVIGIRRAILAREPVQYAYRDLHASVSEYLDAIVAMLQGLSRVAVLRR